MKLNCWPGCIAQVVRSPYPENVGKHVLVLDTVDADPGEWRVECLAAMTGQVGPDRFAVHPPGSIGWGHDKSLRPITPPPGTVTDEEVTQLYAPQVKEHA